jgi:hypothetical protein
LEATTLLHLPLTEDIVVGLPLLPLLVDLLLAFDDQLLQLSDPEKTTNQGPIFRNFFFRGNSLSAVGKRSRIPC